MSCNQQFIEKIDMMQGQFGRALVNLLSIMRVKFYKEDGL